MCLLKFKIHYCSWFTFTWFILDLRTFVAKSALSRLRALGGTFWPKLVGGGTKTFSRTGKYRKWCHDELVLNYGDWWWWWYSWRWLLWWWCFRRSWWWYWWRQPPCSTPVYSPSNADVGTHHDYRSVQSVHFASIFPTWCIGRIYLVSCPSRWSLY